MSIRYKCNYAGCFRPKTATWDLSIVQGRKHRAIGCSPLSAPPERVRGAHPCVLLASIPARTSDPGFRALPQQFASNPFYTEWTL
jgi:hypothetical protein